MILLRWIGSLLFPPKCVLCGRVLKKDQLDLCMDCRTGANYYSCKKTKIQFLDSLTAVWYYEGNVRKSLLRFKFYGARHFAPSYGRLLAMRVLQAHPEGFDILTWVPVSAHRKSQRGYDQVELIAEAVSRELSIPLTPLLKKIRDNPPQSGMASDALRRANVAGAYCLLNKTDLSGKRILLLDDIFTTGATAGEAARILLAAGAVEVHCAAMAAARK